MLYQLQYRLNALNNLLGEDTSYYSASLSFYTIFSIIPMFWVTFFVLGEFDVFMLYYQDIKVFLMNNLMPTQTELVSEYFDEFIANSRKMGFWGLVYVMFASVLFYKNYQHVVNKIFFKPSNSFWHAFETYLILAFIMPLVLGMVFFLNDYVLRHMVGSEQLAIIIAGLSFAIVWLLFFIVYKISPNMKISYRVALLSSFVVSLVWVLVKMAFVQYVLVNESYTSLYGSFSVLLFLLLWIYLSWFMLLQGLRLCYVLQCHHE
ncbi:MAG: YihY family inner membrane protein [Gammaproteobacteria bacterium]|nr:YihY family inner membrane protein [Gammaproteobacteria bacterium]